MQFELNNFSKGGTHEEVNLARAPKWTNEPTGCSEFNAGRRACAATGDRTRRVAARHSQRKPDLIEDFSDSRLSDGSCVLFSFLQVAFCSKNSFEQFIVLLESLRFTAQELGIDLDLLKSAKVRRSSDDESSAGVCAGEAAAVTAAVAAAEATGRDDGVRSRVGSGATALPPCPRAPGSGSLCPLLPPE
ncbi:hypothetical protein AXF42_Ash006548 [Apostasia shenzhenica]|uniref:Uncharacterized protein n=1 Tax=Apostasia shenzhenica TaxID=1088818 RepID=A0A2I0AZD3_9ASPA|nr:hypothetical protein AXF42_Ash006548 [Apostasia shenzhenica]